jgi:hypothetical protein
MMRRGTQSSFQLLQGKLLVARPRCCNGEILKDAAAVGDIFSSGVSAIARRPSSNARSLEQDMPDLKFHV